MLLSLWNALWPEYFPLYRASQDSQQGILNDGPAIQHYLVSWIIDKARRDREAAEARKDDH